MRAYPYSEIYVAQSAPGHLVIVDPPYYLLGLPFLLIGAGLFLSLLFRSRRHVGLLVFAALFLVPGVIFSTGTTTISFDRGSGTVRIAKTYAGWTVRSRTLPLRNVKAAVLGRAAGGGGRSLYLILASGDQVSLGPNTDRQGYAEAANAINDFLER